MSELTRPSNLGEWATCSKKMRHLASNPGPGRGGSHIAGWIGSNVHNRLSESPLVLERPPAMSLYDKITPNLNTARIQSSRIVGKFRQAMETMGLTPVMWEKPVEDEDGNSGTLDVVLRQDTPSQLIVADVKTGRRVPAGVWLQLGAYYKMARSYRQSPEAKWCLPMVLVAVIHLPRTPLGEEQPWSIDFRDGAKCAKEAALWFRTVGNLLKDDAEVEEYLASPGIACGTCPMTVTECAVKIERPTN